MRFFCILFFKEVFKEKYLRLLENRQAVWLQPLDAIQLVRRRGNSVLSAVQSD